MKSLTEIITKNNFFYISVLLLIIACSLFLCIYSRAEGFVLMNSFHSTALTIFFKNITYCGDGLFTLILFAIIMFFFKKHRELGLLLLIGYLSSGILSQIIKNFVFSPRPNAYFAYYHPNYHLDTFLKIKSYRSFPSGHTASVFAMSTILTNYFKKRYLYPLLLLFAVTIGYSRIYLAQHFLIDVLAGAIIGVLSGTFCILWYSKNKIKINKIIIQLTQKLLLRMQNFKTQDKPKANI
ncbi:phosphatase PAP2 family protein [Flavobacterium aquicola]|uniref:Membrane-associated phospholipid phosphatase n=1 Tax=Flavobacterium aquicola TaxID=1682742 RepID=A0A3E0EQT4_9FLAO|nr:phosphatase PAP2 family protein [Flavobacterium aquicola]REH00091.1 membrane-associated phospholipid phosphatase [Flavobacterium aquicola]